MIEIFVIILFCFCFIVYDILHMKPQIRSLKDSIEQLTNDIRFNNKEIQQHLENINHMINKNKLEAKDDVRQNKNEIVKLRSKIGKQR